MTHKAAAKFTTVQRTLADRLAGRERGASALEYVGMVLVAAMIVAAVVAAVDIGTLQSNLTSKVNEIINIGGE